jgi:hypothetical protein
MANVPYALGAFAADVFLMFCVLFRQHPGGDRDSVRRSERAQGLHAEVALLADPEGPPAARGQVPQVARCCFARKAVSQALVAEQFFCIMRLMK